MVDAVFMEGTAKAQERNWDAKNAASAGCAMDTIQVTRLSRERKTDTYLWLEIF
ncbi:MAG TPA: hypothetical protein VLE96_02550 [Chlamydiales bacterium]|nr:hypothetical protein [Chlamydiales bacterium]